MRLPAFATRNLRLKALAAALATVIWAGVVYASNPPDTRSVTLAVPQDDAQVSPYVLVHPIRDLVVRVAGTREHLGAFLPNDIVLSVNYKAITQPGLQQVPVSVVNNDRDVILDNPPTTVAAEVDHRASATVPVTVVVSTTPPQGYVVTDTSTDPSTVTVIGPQNQLAGVQARANIDLGNRKTTVQADERVLLFDRAGQQLGSFGITILTIPGHTQGTVQVTVTVAASLTSRASAVLPRVVGTVAPGHQVAGITQSPLTVVLNGPQDLLNTLDSIPTQPVSLNGLQTSRTFTVQIVTPAGVTATPGTVTVTVTVNTAPLGTPAATPVPSASPTPTPSPTP